MPRRRAKSRIELLADALVDAKDMQEALHAIDLRKATGELREAIKAAREQAASTQEILERAILDLDDMPYTGTRT